MNTINTTTNYSTINKETLTEGGFKYFGSLGHGEHILKTIPDHPDQTVRYEIWFCNKYHASYGLVWRNTHLEFARDATQADLDRLAKRRSRK